MQQPSRSMNSISASQLTLPHRSLRSDATVDLDTPRPHSHHPVTSTRTLFRRVTLSLARTVFCCSSSSSSSLTRRSRKEQQEGSLSRRRQSCSRRRKFSPRETRSATRCWLEGSNSAVSCEIEFNPCFDHFEGQLLHTRLVNSAFSATGVSASSSILLSQRSGSIGGPVGTTRAERSVPRNMGLGSSSSGSVSNSNISASSIVHLTRSQLSLHSTTRDQSACATGSRGGSEVCLSGISSLPSVYDCPVCFCEYTMQGPQTPHVLPCGHSVCQECTIKLVGNANSLNNLSGNPAGVLASLGHSKEAKCPFCRRPLPTQKNAISINYALLAILDQNLNASRGYKKALSCEQVKLPNDQNTRDRNENEQKVEANPDSMMTLSKTENQRNSTHAALKRLRVSYQPDESSTDIRQNESRGVATLNRGQSQDSNNVIVINEERRASCQFAGKQGGKQPMLLDPNDIESHGPQTRLHEAVRMTGGGGCGGPVYKRLLGPSKSASILCEQSSSAGSSRGYLSSASSSTKLTPPTVPPKMPLNYDFIQAGENIPCSRMPDHITASSASLSKDDHH